MELPERLRLAIEKRAEEYPISALVKSAAGISERYRGESGRGERLVSEKADILAYAISRMPATYGAARSALSACPGGVKTVLDMGAGTGAASWAALNLFGGIESITCVEREPEMMDFGRALLDDARVKWINADMRSFDCSGTFDLVIASYSLNELNAADIGGVCDKLWKLTAGTLVIIDPGTPEAFARMCDIRKRFIERGAHVAAPCPHDGECPLSEGDWCHFTCRIARSRLHKLLKGGDAPYEDEKFSYLVLTREEPMRAVGRVLRHPQVESGKITLRLCAPSGIETRIITKRQKDAFKIARKLKCGDVFDIKQTI